MHLQTLFFIVCSVINSFCITITFHIPVKVYFSIKKYTSYFNSNCKKYFFLKPSFNRNFCVQNQLPISGIKQVHIMYEK